MKFLKSVLTYIRRTNLTAIAQAAMTSIGGAAGWVARFLGGFLIKALEILVDKEIQKIEDRIDISESDKANAERAKANAQKINDAKTDSELDDAFRNSLD